MKKKLRYTDELIGPLRVIDDSLPPPQELAFKEDTVKVTLSLSKASVGFFEEEVRKHQTQYQKMIRRLLDHYVAQHQSPDAKQTRARR